MTGSRLAMVLIPALAALGLQMPPAEAEALPDALSEWREADNMGELIVTLELWLDLHTEWPRRSDVPRVRLVTEWEAAARRASTGSLHSGRLRGLYDPVAGEILLVRPWNPRSANDVSVLLHELVHHRQAPHHWYCPAAQELPAYRLQEEWLAERGLSANVNWISVLLAAGCTPRDIHPE